jgi:hypothetical protein
MDSGTLLFSMARGAEINGESSLSIKLAAHSQQWWFSTTCGAGFSAAA